MTLTETESGWNNAADASWQDFSIDPWYDYLALPVAPVVLLVQGFALSLPSPWRQGVVLAGTIAVAVMLVVAWTVDTGEGVNVGGGLLAIWLIVSVVLAVRAFRRRATDMAG